jgi:DNA-binding CsgD family transcriptional regulator
VPAWLGPAVLGTALLQSGAVREGIPLVVQAIESSKRWSPAEPVGLALLLDVVALDELLLADGSTAEVRAHELQSRLVDDTGATAAGVAATEAWRAWRRGTWVAALSLADEAATTARALGAGATERTALAVAVRVTATTSSPSFAMLLETLRRASTRVGDRSALLAADAAEGLRALGTVDAARAVCMLERVGESQLWGRTTADPALAGRLDLVEAYVWSGDIDSARLLADDLAPRLEARATIDPEATARRLRMLAVTAPAPKRPALFEDALAAHPTDRCRFEAARTHLAYSAQLRRTGASEAADRHRKAARVEFERLGATVWTRAAGGHGGDEAPALAGLTAQERRVARLVASGASNRQVADTLCLSTRTVESHLASVYRKLGLQRRGQLAALMAGTEIEP